MLAAIEDRNFRKQVLNKYYEGSFSNKFLAMLNTHRKRVRVVLRYPTNIVIK